LREGRKETSGLKKNEIFFFKKNIAPRLSLKNERKKKKSLTVASAVGASAKVAAPGRPCAGIPSTPTATPALSTRSKTAVGTVFAAVSAAAARPSRSSSPPPLEERGSRLSLLGDGGA
jgi:hypothetical protein